MKLTDLRDFAERAATVSLFDARSGEMEQVLRLLSVSSRPGLLAGQNSPALETLVWTVKSWRECRASGPRRGPRWPGHWRSR